MTTSVKTCFKCLSKKPLADFYSHKHMKDGHLNKCKDCTKRDARDRRFDPKFREKVLSYDRERGSRQTDEYRKMREENHGHKRKASNLVNNAVRDGRLLKPDRCSHCHSNEKRVVGHHPDYSKPLEVVWLCDSCHQNLHALLRTVEEKTVRQEAG